MKSPQTDVQNAATKDGKPAESTTQMVGNQEKKSDLSEADDMKGILARLNALELENKVLKTERSQHRAYVPEVMKQADATVKAKAIRDIRVVRNEVVNGQIVPSDVIVPAGQTAMLTEAEAKEFCDKTFDGTHAFKGDRAEADGDVKRHKIVRAQRVA